MSLGPEEGPVVLYIGGYERSGSTLVQNVLGQLENTFAAGELRHFWHRAIGQNRLCGCGQRVKQCGIWRDIVDRAAGGMDSIDPDRLTLLQRRFRNRNSLMLFLPYGRKLLGRGIKGYLSLLKRLYVAIQTVSGADVIIDTSKTPVFAFGLSELVGLDVKVLHLVRDPRAVAYSIYKRKLQGHPAYEGHSMFQVGIEWLLVNAVTEALGRNAGDRYLRIQYETFTAKPASVVKDVCDWIGTDLQGLRLRDDGVVDLAPTHTVGGSPHRFETGEVTIRIDDEWKSELPRRERRSVGCVTYPLLHRYGYA